MCIRDSLGLGRAHDEHAALSPANGSGMQHREGLSLPGARGPSPPAAWYDRPVETDPSDPTREP